MSKRIVRTIIEKCLGVRKKEEFLIVSDDKLFRLASDIYEIAKGLGVKVLLIKMPPLKMHGEEPPRIIAEALKASDTAILLTEKSLSHTRARKEASKKYGRRIASLPGITKEIFNRSIDIDYNVLGKNIKRVADLLSKGKKLEIYTDRGTRLAMSIKGRKGFSDNGVYTKRGAFGNLPAGEACTAPVECTTNGILVIDGSAPLIGKVKHPVKMAVKNGYASNTGFPKINAQIKSLGKNAFNVAEIGIGLNPKAKVTGNILEDEKARFTAHLAIGNNESFGGKVYCPCHLDFVFLNPVIFIDGKKVII